jgi:hypothetical protein
MSLIAKFRASILLPVLAWIVPAACCQSPITIDYPGATSTFATAIRRRHAPLPKTHVLIRSRTLFMKTKRIALIRNGKTIWQHGFRVKDKTGEAVPADTIFEVAYLGRPVFTC